MKKKIISFAAAFLCLTALNAKAKILAVDTDSTDVGVYGNTTVQSLTTEDGIQLSVSAKLCDYGVKYYFDIENKSGDSYHFDDASIRVFGGNKDTNQWDDLGYETASRYYKERQTQVVVGAIVDIALVTTAVATDIASSSPGRRDPGFWDPHRMPAPHYHPDPFLESLAIANMFYLLDMEDDDSLSYLEKNLLYSAQIPDGKEYAGVFYVQEGNCPDYKVRVQVSSSETVEFLFTRSDRERILHPFADRDELNAVLLGITVPGANRFSTYGIFSGELLGGYFGFTGGSERLYDFRSDYGKGYNRDNIDLTSNAPYWAGYDSRKYDYRYSFANASQSALNCFGVFGGMTVKPVPHVYIMAGCGFEFGYYSYYGDFYYQEKVFADKTFSGKTKFAEGWYNDYSSWRCFCTPQAGVNFNFGYFDFAGLVEYRIGDGFMAEILLGGAF